MDYTFKQFKLAMQANFDAIIRVCEKTLYTTNLDKDMLWDTFLSNFPDELKQEYTCNCCRQFIRNYGDLVAIVDGKMTSIWKFSTEEPFITVAAAMDKWVTGAVIENQFFTKHKGLGTDRNVQLLKEPDADGNLTTTWEHMYFELPPAMVSKGKDSVESLMGPVRDKKNVFRRSLDEISMDAVTTVLDLIDQGTLYRGQEHKRSVQEFKTIKAAYELIPDEMRDNFCWYNSNKFAGSVAKIRGTSIGTLLMNISEGKNLDFALTAFEKIMAPGNYKRPNPVYSQRQIEAAEATIMELGFKDSLGRRFATADDVTVDMTLFVDRDAKPDTSLLGMLADGMTVKPKSLSRTDEISSIDFVQKIIPQATSIEAFFENQHINNLVSLITAKNAGAPFLTKWNNPFTWSYKNAVTDSIKEKVKEAGGKVEGELRASLEWYNFDDLDIHIIEPDGNHISWEKKFGHMSQGSLDVDMNAGSGQTRSGVENIIYTDKARMQEGKYKVFIHQYNKRESVDYGFKVELECKGKLLTFSYGKMMRTEEKVVVVEFVYSKAAGIEIVTSLPHETHGISKKVWNLDTNRFHKVDMIMKSPNFWNGAASGNEHLFFMIVGTHNDEKPRGFFNEFLKPELEQNHKHVFEALAGKLNVEPADKQVSGLGFSSTRPADLIVKVGGSFDRTMKIKFS